MTARDPAAHPDVLAKISRLTDVPADRIVHALRLWEHERPTAPTRVSQISAAALELYDRRVTELVAASLERIVAEARVPEGSEPAAEFRVFCEGFAARLAADVTMLGTSLLRALRLGPDGTADLDATALAGRVEVDEEGRLLGVFPDEVHALEIRAGRAAIIVATLRERGWKGLGPEEIAYVENIVGRDAEVIRELIRAAEEPWSNPDARNEYRDVRVVRISEVEIEQLEKWMIATEPGFAEMGSEVLRDKVRADELEKARAAAPKIPTDHPALGPLDAAFLREFVRRTDHVVSQTVAELWRIRHKVAEHDHCVAVRRMARELVALCDQKNGADWAAIFPGELAVCIRLCGDALSAPVYVKSRDRADVERAHRRLRARIAAVEVRDQEKLDEPAVLEADEEERMVCRRVATGGPISVTDCMTVESVRSRFDFEDAT